jgi:hypothetical protein
MTFNKFCWLTIAGIFSFAFAYAILVKDLGHDWDRIVFGLPFGFITGSLEVILGFYAGYFVLKMAFMELKA